MHWKVDQISSRADASWLGLEAHAHVRVHFQEKTHPQELDGLRQLDVHPDWLDSFAANLFEAHVLNQPLVVVPLDICPNPIFILKDNSSGSSYQSDQRSIWEIRSWACQRVFHVIQNDKGQVWLPSFYSTPHQNNVKLRWIIRSTCLGYNELEKHMCKQSFIHSQLCESNLTIRASSKFLCSLFDGLRMLAAVRSTLFPFIIERPTGSPSSSEKRSWKTFSSSSLAKFSKFTSRGAQIPLDLKSDSKRSLAELSRKSLGLLAIVDEVSDPFLFTIVVKAIFDREEKEISEIERERW
ncbi:uncharacterized protein G2W53_041369 [Senna tora]|uniref:Uncharacterized protein n=1 Tax=Senna tora TaxID=362788 RepID=A0A834SHA4_9FABA|nr:uncharacterized protein G2W53_041369 [Senna tora]